MGADYDSKDSKWVNPNTTESNGYTPGSTDAIGCIFLGTFERTWAKMMNVVWDFILKGFATFQVFHRHQAYFMNLHQWINFTFSKLLFKTLIFRSCCGPTEMVNLHSLPPEPSVRIGSLRRTFGNLSPIVQPHRW